MKIFVPKYRQDMPPEDFWRFIGMFVEVSEQNLRERVIPFWQEHAKAKYEDPDVYFRQNIKNICERKKYTLEPFFRRPSITIHAASTLGNDKIFADTAYNAGKSVAREGFNLWYGGGKNGLMGKAVAGFIDERERIGALPDQYAIQVIPGDFVLGVTSVNGMRPENEGLCCVTDAALVMPHFVTRREILDGRCAASVTCPGGLGTANEWTDMATGEKVGTQAIPFYTINVQIGEDGERYWDWLRRGMDVMAKCGFLNPDFIKRTRFVNTPEEALEDLMVKLKKENATPSEVYKAYCTENKVEPGVPMRSEDFAHLITKSFLKHPLSTPAFS